MTQFLHNRTEIAKAINFGKYAVVFADLEKSRTEYGWDLGQVRLDLGEAHEKAHGYRYDEASLYVYKDEMQLTTSNPGTMLTASFGAQDVFKMAARANAPALPVTPGAQFVLVLKTAAGGAAVMMVTVDHFTKFCSTPLTFKDADFSKVLYACGEEVCGEKAVNA